MRILLIFLLHVPISVLAVDNTMINAEIKPLKLQQAPVVGTAFRPGTEPGVVISLPDNQASVIPGYRVRFNDLSFIVGVSCKADLSDDCSEYIYSDDYADRSVYIRYIQTADSHFKTPEGARIGDSWQQTLQRLEGEPIIYSSNDSCVQLKSEWHACIDLMSIDRRFDPQMRRLLPKMAAMIDFYYKK